MSAPILTVSFGGARSGVAMRISRQNACPRPLRWTKSADDILASIDRFCRRTLEVHAQSG